MKKQEIISVLYELHKITGFRMSLHDVDFKEIAAYPDKALPLCGAIQAIDGEYRKCFDCDKEAFHKVLKTKEPVIYKCRYGLTEAVSPLYNFGILTGFLMMGQIGDEHTDTNEIINKLLSIGYTPSQAQRLMADYRSTSSDMTKSYIKIMTVCAQYLTLSNAMPGAKPTVAQTAKRFIHENFDKHITIKDICDEAKCSKSTLISSFKKEFGITVNAAITDARLEEAKKLLISEDLCFSEIAQRTGFYDQAYFSKVFSAKYGITPSEFKRRN